MRELKNVLKLLLLLSWVALLTVAGLFALNTLRENKESSTYETVAEEGP